MTNRKYLKNKILEAFENAGEAIQEIEDTFNRGFDIEISFKKIGLGSKSNYLVIEFSNPAEAKEAEIVLQGMRGGDAGWSHYKSSQEDNGQADGFKFNPAFTVGL